MSYSVLIVDDEPLARERLKRLLLNHDEFKVVGIAEHGAAALEFLTQQVVDVVLLDIQMPGMNGLETAEKMQQLKNVPQVIFCTAYDEHALAAFRVQAIDYLLKPIRSEELARALNRVHEWLVARPNVLHEAAQQNTHIVSSGHRGVERIAIENVLACVAEQKYVQVFHRDGAVLVDESLKQLEQNFPNYFVRSHRSALVAQDKIQRLQYLTEGGCQLWIADLSQPIPVSRRHLAAVKALLSM